MNVPAHMMQGILPQAHQPANPYAAAPAHAMQPPAQFAQNPAPYAQPAPAPAPAVPPAYTVPAHQRGLPTAEQMREPYNVITDPTRVGSAEELLNQQRSGIDPREQGARLAQARQDQIAQMAHERAEHLAAENARLAQEQAQLSQTVANMQGQLQAATAPPPVDPMAQYALTQEEQENLGESLPSIQKMMQAAETAAYTRAQQENKQALAAQQTQFNEQLQPLAQQVQQNAATAETMWNDDFVAAVHDEMNFNVMGMKGDPAWEHFIAQPVPFTNGTTYGTQLVNCIKGKNKNDAMAIVRQFHQANLAQHPTYTHSPGAAPVMAPSQVRAPVGMGQVDPMAERIELSRQYTELTDRLSRQQLTIPEFQLAAKPIDDRLAELSRAA